MKLRHLKKLLIFGVFTFVLMPHVAMAEEIQDVYENRNGVKMERTNYSYLVEKLGEEHVMFMTQNEYDRLKDKELTLIAYDSKTVETIDYNGVEVEQVTPRSVNGFENDHVTASKNLTLMVFEDGTNQFYVKAVNEWLTLPSTRSYDVLALRTDDGLSVIDTTQQGTQLYAIDGVMDSVLYQYNGSNTVRRSNGYGFSMNLLDSRDVDHFINTTTCFISGASGTVSVSYQHATRSLSRADSMEYTLNVNGLGGVILFSEYSTLDKYDRMAGVWVEV